MFLLLIFLHQTHVKDIDRSCGLNDQLTLYDTLCL
jgi:hypothetical protein